MIYNKIKNVISLSLSYHAESLVGSGVSVTAPPINYLQCPAAVTVHHLKRFVSAKYGIDIERDVNIEIICEDEVLPEDFTLMDVAYCFNWTRVSTHTDARFFYDEENLLKI